MTDDLGWFSEETATFGDRLAGAREAAGMDQKALAEKLGVKTNVISGWENDLKEPRANRLQMVSGILGVSITWLLTGEGDGPDAPDDQIVLSNDLLDMLAEMRSLRGQIAQTGENLARLEKRLRAALKDPT
ncbi:MAG: helix-turn-helix domain-containing protein [Yoonia sp.]|jgi:HTH-type transcriptional regulator, cell division transcriptional repressor|uniref:helix-turn-helix domain-containing protein n=1 Tax=Yoonia sp. TaxID=2212373 RepID=UPI00273FCE84|nr:helix-turn-helix transcriptional regulator [Yoonia sp.]MDP5086907.1 helix-turn-helix domain-containing protein [Yoonia sp.]MDP5359532.1 helix-turn-helix domain-containing protein [Paracoccaceae bacterium]